MIIIGLLLKLLIMGIQTKDMSKIFNYSFSTSEYKKTNIYNDFSLNSPISGFGYGLPISKIYLEYFGGKIEICSNWPIGTDTYIILRIKGDYNEPLH